MPVTPKGLMEVSGVFSVAKWLIVMRFDDVFPSMNSKAAPKGGLFGPFENPTEKTLSIPTAQPRAKMSVTH